MLHKLEFRSINKSMKLIIIGVVIVAIVALLLMGYLKFETECQNLGIFYLKQTDGKGGKYDVLIDGERKSVLDADFSGGWGNYGETQQIIIGKESGKHTVEIKLSEGSDKTALTIFGIMVS